MLPHPPSRCVLCTHILYWYFHICYQWPLHFLFASYTTAVCQEVIFEVLLSRFNISGHTTLTQSLDRGVHLSYCCSQDLLEKSTALFLLGFKGMCKHTQAAVQSVRSWEINKPSSAMTRCPAFTSAQEAYWSRCCTITRASKCTSIFGPWNSTPAAEVIQDSLQLHCKYMYISKGIHLARLCTVHTHAHTPDTVYVSNKKN